MSADETDRRSSFPRSLSDALEADARLARDHDVEFSVASRLSHEDPALRGPPESREGFQSPGEAVAYAMTLRNRDVTVLADGRGSYWSPATPDEVDSRLLRLVCRDRRLGPDEAQREWKRQELRDTIERFRAEQRFGEAAEVVRGSATMAEAKARLQSQPLFFTASQASHLIVNSRLGLLTEERQQDVRSKLERAAEELAGLGPSIEELPD